MLILIVSVASATMAAGLKLEDVAASRLVLIHDTKIEVYRLAGNGVALATFGVRGGAVAGPTYHWEIKDGRLVLTVRRDATREPEITESFELVERDANTLTLRRRGGELVVFEIGPLKLLGIKGPAEPRSPEPVMSGR